MHIARLLPDDPESHGGVKEHVLHLCRERLDVIHLHEPMLWLPLLMIAGVAIHRDPPPGQGVA